MTDNGKFSKETEHVQGLATQSEDFFYYSHALEQMAKRGVDKFDVASALRSGIVIVDQTVKPVEHKWKVRGKGVDGRGIELVIVIKNGELEIRIVTVWPLAGRKK